jgi:hypothetical protein
MAGQRAVIYLRGTGRGQLDDAEKRCGEYAQRFGWQVLKSVRDANDGSGLGQLLMQVNELRIQIIITGSLDMISPDQSIRDDLMATIERSQCIVQPVEMSPRP